MTETREVYSGVKHRRLWLVATIDLWRLARRVVKDATALPTVISPSLMLQCGSIFIQVASTNCLSYLLLVFQMSWAEAGSKLCLVCVNLCAVLVQ